MLLESSSETTVPENALHALLDHLARYRLTVFPALQRLPQFTAELIEQTQRVWQPYYEQILSPDEALAIIMSMGRIVDFLAEDAQTPPPHLPDSEV